jgi:Flp pilus assembly protein TadG
VQTLFRTDGAEIVEFAVALPLLMVIVVGIYDFGTAFSIKDKLNNAALEAARTASNQPVADLSNNTPGSIQAIRDVVHNILTASKVNDCGLGTATPTKTAGKLTWTYTLTCSAAETFTMKIERGFTYPVPLPTPYPSDPYTVEATQVTLQYPYKLTFSKVIKVLSPTSTYADPLIKAVAVMQNLS